MSDLPIQASPSPFTIHALSLLLSSTLIITTIRAYVLSHSEFRHLAPSFPLVTNLVYQATLHAGVQVHRASEVVRNRRGPVDHLARVSGRGLRVATRARAACSCTLLLVVRSSALLVRTVTINRIVWLLKNQCPVLWAKWNWSLHTKLELSVKVQQRFTRSLWHLQAESTEEEEMSRCLTSPSPAPLITCFSPFINYRGRILDAFKHDVIKIVLKCCDFPISTIVYTSSYQLWCLKSATSFSPNFRTD